MGSGIRCCRITQHTSASYCCSYLCLRSFTEAFTTFPDSHVRYISISSVSYQVPLMERIFALNNGQLSYCLAVFSFKPTLSFLWKANGVCCPITVMEVIQSRKLSDSFFTQFAQLLDCRDSVIPMQWGTWPCISTFLREATPLDVHHAERPLPQKPLFALGSLLWELPSEISSWKSSFQACAVLS